MSSIVRRSVLGLFLVATLLASSVTNLYATANFARKYHAQCTLCHTMYPQLNATGYKFRQLGYRLPSEVAQRLKLQPTASHARPGAEQLTGAAAKGMDVYQANNCSVCHTIGAVGGQVGPALDDVASKRSAQWLREFLLNPAKVVPGSAMSPLKATSEELDGLVAYLLSPSKSAARAGVGAEKEWKFDFAEGASFRFRPRYNVQKRPGDVVRTDFNASDVTFFYTGPATNHLSYFFEANLLEAGGPSELEVGNFQYNFGGSEVFSYMRVGQYHVIGRVGQGVLDRPVTISTPLMLGNRVNGLRFSTNGRGGEGAFSYKGTTLRTFYLNSLAFSAEDPELPDDGADPLGIGRQNQSRSPSFAVVGEHVFPGTISGFTVAFLHFRGPSVAGSVGKFVGDSTVAATGTNDRTMDRLVMGGNYLRSSNGRPNFHILGGVGLGFDTRLAADKLVVANPALLGQRQRSYGFFGEFDKYIKGNIVAASRFDYFRPDTQAAKNITRQLVFALIGNIDNHMRLTGEYRLIRFYPTATTSTLKTDNRFQSEFQFNF